ncbi:hypothetical protein [Virgibacillus sp. YIM 98842]|uniref:hypothetical protein n=1 Tax=Virgibacillus sp. YIM 98842 TaxID=2663533 RepID=UPI0013DBAE13|nr:hypothetical protein [Virgibacillus sp. YIM 98842]
MAVFKFNKNYRDKELKREVKANEPVEMTVKRADEVVKNIRNQSNKFKGYEDFEYERLDKDEEKTPDDNFDREAAKKRLEELGVEFKGNAKNETLKNLLEEHEQPEAEENVGDGK